MDETTSEEEREPENIPEISFGEIYLFGFFSVKRIVWNFSSPEMIHSMLFTHESKYVFDISSILSGMPDDGMKYL